MSFYEFQQKLAIAALIIMAATFFGGWYFVWPTLHPMMGTGIGAWIVTFVATAFISGILARVATALTVLGAYAGIILYELLIHSYYRRYRSKARGWWYKVENPDDYIELRYVPNSHYLLTMEDIMEGTVAQNRVHFAQFEDGQLLHVKANKADRRRVYILKRDVEHFQPLLDELKAKESLSYAS